MTFVSENARNQGWDGACGVEIGAWLSSLGWRRGGHNSSVTRREMKRFTLIRWGAALSLVGHPGVFYAGDLGPSARKSKGIRQLPNEPFWKLGVYLQVNRAKTKAHVSGSRHAKPAKNGVS